MGLLERLGLSGTPRPRGDPVSEFVREVRHDTQDFVCDTSQLTGPLACLHNEHNAILKGIEALSGNDAVLEHKLNELLERAKDLQDRTSDLQGRVGNLERQGQELLNRSTRILNFLDTHFEGAP